MKPAVKTLAGFRKAKRTLIRKEFLRIKRPLLKQNNGKLYLNSSAYQYVMQIQRDIREFEFNKFQKQIEVNLSNVTGIYMIL